MADSNVSVKFSGDTSDLDAAVKKATSLVTSFGDSLAKALGANATTDGLAKQFKDTGDQADKSGTQASSAFASLKSTVENATLGIGALATGALALLAGTGLAATALGEQIKTSAGAFDQSLQSISALKSVADSAGLGVDKLGKSFFDLQTKAKAGDEAVVAALKAIGLSASDVAGLSEDALAVKLAGSFSTAADSSRKAAAAVALFGSDTAAKLVPQLDQGATRMRDLEDAANRAGTVIGPDLSGKLSGTRSVIQGANDALHELRMTVDGALLASFATFKPAIDGLGRAFTDLVSNVTQFVQWANNLNGAAQRNAESTGFFADAANLLAKAVIGATTYIEELAVRGVQYLQGLGIAFGDLTAVATAFGNDLKGIAAASAAAFYGAYEEAIRGVILLFGDLSDAGRRALSFDLSGARASVTQFGVDASAMGDKVRQALSPAYFEGTAAALAKMKGDAAAEAASLDTVIAKLEQQKAAQLAVIAAGGVKAPEAGTRQVGDPTVHKEDDKSDGKLAAALKELDGEIAAVKQAEKQKETLIDAGVKLHILSEDQKAAGTKNALDREYADQMALYKKELELDGLKITQRQEILNKIKALEDAHTENTLRNQIAAAEATQKTWDSAMGSINSAFDSQVSGLLKGTTKWSAAFKNVLASLTEDIIKFCVKWAMQQAETVAMNILGINAEVTAQIAGVSASTAAVSAGATAQGATKLGAIASSIMASASETFAGIFGFLSPILGPAAAVPAAAGEATVAAKAVLPSFAIGSWALPSNMIAQVHAGEMIVPASQTPWAQSLMANAAGGQGGGDMHAHFNISHTSYGSRSDKAIQAESAVMIKAIHQDMQTNRPTWRKVLSKT